MQGLCLAEGLRRAVVAALCLKTRLAVRAKVAMCLVGKCRAWTQTRRTVRIQMARTTVCIVVLPARRFGAKAVAVVAEEAVRVRDLRVQVAAVTAVVAAGVVVARPRKILVARAAAVATCLDGKSRAWTRPSRTARAPRAKMMAYMVVPQAPRSGAVAPVVAVDRALVGAEAVLNFPRRAAEKAGQTRTANAAASARRTAIVHPVRLASRTCRQVRALRSHRKSH